MEERDLSFQPVTNDNPKHLTPDQIHHYNEQGYIRPIPIFGPEEVEKNRSYLDSLLCQLNELRDGRDAYALNCYQTRCEGIWDLVMHPGILDYVEDIVGPNIVGWATHYFCKLPHDPKIVPWHQDASYWRLSPARTVTVWLAIDDADAENAAMQFIPGSHRQGPLDWKEADRPAVLNQEIINIQQYGQPVYDELKAGEMSLHADMLAHGSAPNTSDRRRCGLTIRYCTPSVRPVDPGWGAGSLICRGSDPTGRWANIPRPVGDDLSTGSKPKSVGGN